MVYHQTEPRKGNWVPIPMVHHQTHRGIDSRTVTTPLLRDRHVGEGKAGSIYSESVQAWLYSVR